MSEKESRQAMYCRMQAENAMQRGDFRRAKEWCERGLEADPNEAELWNKLGWCEWKLNNPHRAIECFDKASAANSQHMMALVNKGMVLKNIGHVFEAIECYDQALSIPPGEFALDGDRKRAWYNKGLAHYILYQSGQDIVPAAVYLPQDAARIHFSAKQGNVGIHCEEALRCCRESLAIDPTYQFAIRLEQSIESGEPFW